MKSDDRRSMDATVDRKFADVQDDTDRRFDRLFEEIQSIRHLVERDRRFDALAVSIDAMRLSFESKLERLLQLHERDALFRDDVDQRLAAYLTRTLSTEQRVEALEGAALPISAKRRPKATGKK